MKTKTKKALAKLRAHAKTAKKVKAHAGRLARRKVAKKRTGRLLARAFFILVAAISTGSLAFTVTTTKPTIEVELRTNIAQAVEQLNPGPFDRPPDQAGVASWYALGLPQPDALTCASTKFPRGTYLLVTSLRNARSVICRVNDYGPQPWTNRVIDLSRGSFRVIEDLSRGTVPVEVRVVPAPAASFKLPFPTDVAAAVGYAQCEQIFTKQYCEDNRQENKNL